MRISTKNFLNTILMAALSLILIFAVSCGDKPTGSTPAKGDAIFNSFPKATGNKITDFEPNITYKGTLSFDETGFDFTGDYGGMTKDEVLENVGKDDMKVILTITKDAGGYNIVKLEETYDPSSGVGGIPTSYTLFENATLLKNGDIYNAEVSKEVSGNDSDEDEGFTGTVTHKDYIKFKVTGNTLTDFEYVTAFTEKGSSYDEETKQTINYDYGMKMTYTGTLTKQ